MARRIPPTAACETLELHASIRRSDALRAEGYKVEERVTRVAGVRMVRIYFWRA